MLLGRIRMRPNDAPHACNRIPYERDSIFLTNNKGFRDWNTVFPNATSIAVLLDRPTHHADVTVLEGTPYRVRESEPGAASC